MDPVGRRPNSRQNAYVTENSNRARRRRGSTPKRQQQRQPQPTRLSTAVPCSWLCLTQNLLQRDENTQKKFLGTTYKLSQKAHFLENFRDFFGAHKGRAKNNALQLPLPQILLLAISGHLFRSYSSVSSSCSSFWATPRPLALCFVPILVLLDARGSLRAVQLFWMLNTRYCG
jgi:hypothetical protein